MGKIGHWVAFGLLLLGSLSAVSVQAQTDPKVGLRAGLDTDINLGLAYGVGANYLLSYPQNSLELGIV